MEQTPYVWQDEKIKLFPENPEITVRRKKNWLSLTCVADSFLQFEIFIFALRRDYGRNVSDMLKNPDGKLGKSPKKA